MSRETKYTAVVLKKQAFGEGDEIITFFSKEQGKVRGLAKSVKLAKSKLQQSLQTLFLVNLSLTNGTLPKIIAVEPLQVFANIRQNLFAAKMAFYAIELVIKFTADEEKNLQLFNLLVKFFNFLNAQPEEKFLALGLAKFKIEILETLGLGVHSSAQLAKQPEIFFSPNQGGFMQSNTAGAVPVGNGLYSLFLGLKQNDFENLNEFPNQANIQELQNLLAQFVEYQLERKVKSGKYLY